MTNEQIPADSRRLFLIHLGLYATVNIALAALNLSQPPDADGARELWFVWPLAGWGIGIAAHGLALLLQYSGQGGGLYSDAGVRGVTVHLFVYLAVNTLLVAVNTMYSPESLWVVWPLLGWGAALALHGVFVYRAMTRRTLERYAAEQEVLSQIQLERQADQIAASIAPKQKTAASKPKRATGKKPARRKPSTRKPRARKRARAKSKPK
jgi:hypothetical protein